MKRNSRPPNTSDASSRLFNKLENSRYVVTTCDSFNEDDDEKTFVGFVENEWYGKWPFRKNMLKRVTHKGKSSDAAKAIQRVWKLKFTAASNRKHSATQVRSRKPDSRLLVAKHMAHSSSTQKSFYVNKLQNIEAEEAYEVMNEKRVSCSNQFKFG
ncbi:unnamed protein product [Clavelina lepadiformis]|uniref:Uncharacterized protein n=1 Tax=Clavelina lepadiformis TaxID=159417 RepID=A0ABP0G2I5_CLALP